MSSMVSSATKHLAGIAEGVLDLIYPPHCVACGVAGSWFCPECQALIERVPEPLCPHCGRPYLGEGLCVACRNGASHLDTIRSFALHREPLSKTIHALKYDGLRVLAPLLADYLAEAFTQHPVPAQIIVPVPLHRSRQRQRGYNQSYLLARELSRHTGIDIDTRLLRRQRKTHSQVGLSGGQRWDNMSGAFQCSTSDLGGAQILLVDDVLTSGATLEACAIALHEAGADHIWALTLSQAERSIHR